MTNLLGEWLKKDTVDTGTMTFKRTGMKATFRTVDWAQQKNIRRMAGGGMKNKVVNEEEMLSLLIAASLVSIQQGDKVMELNLNDKAVLEQLDAKTVDQAVGKLFRPGEIASVSEFIYSLSDGETSIDELKEE